MTRAAPARAVALVPAVMLVVAACSAPAVEPSGAEPSAVEPSAVEPSGAELERGESTWATVSAGIQADGTVPLDVARQAFAATIAALPGVDAGAWSGTGTVPGAAAVWILEHVDDLSADERAVVDAALFGAAPSAVIPGGPGSARRPADTPIETAVFDIAGDAMEYLRRQLGDLELPGFGVTEVDESKLPAPPGAAPMWLSFRPKSASGGGECRIMVRPTEYQRMRSTVGDPEVLHAVAFTLLQCELLHRAAGSSGQYVAHPPWLISGFSHWGACRYVLGEFESVPELCTQQWRVYLESPATVLFARTLDAAGFFAQLEEAGADPWRAVGAAVTPDSLSAYQTLTRPVIDQLGFQWAAGQWQRPGLGAEWAIEDPAAPVVGRPPALELAPDDELTLDAAPFTVRLEGVVPVDLDIVTVEAAGYVRLHAGGDAVLGADQYHVCTRPEGCECPDDPLEIPSATLLLLGLTGDEAGASATLSGSSLDDFCLEHTGRSSSRSPALSCDQVPAEEIGRITGTMLGDAMVPDGFDPNSIGGQLGCVWTAAPGWSAQIFAADLEAVPSVREYAAACRFWLAKAAVGGRGWVACVGTTPEGYGYLDVTTTKVSMLVTTPPLDVDTLTKVAEAIGTANR